MNKELLISVDRSLPGNLSECSICGNKILPNEEYFDYEYWGHNEIAHLACTYSKPEGEPK